MIGKIFLVPVEGDNCIYLHPEKWFDIATWLKEEESLFFDSLQCQMGIDIGEDKLEFRYNPVFDEA